MSDFIVRTFKAYNSDLIERAWSNTYEIISGGDDPTAIAPIAEAIVAAERNIHVAQVHFLEYTISTWEPDSHPYDPTTFVTSSLGGLNGLRGGVGGADTVLDYNVCLVVKRQPATGRLGRLFFRACLLEQDVKQGGDGRFILDPADAGALLAAFTGFQTALAAFVGVGAGDKLAMIGTVKGAPGVITRRNILLFNLGGVDINKHNHKFFNRS